MSRRGSEGLILAGGGVDHTSHRRLSGTLTNLPSYQDTAASQRFNRESSDPLRASQSSPRKRSSSISANDSPRSPKRTNSIKMDNFRQTRSSNALLTVPVATYNINNISNTNQQVKRRNGRNSQLVSPRESPSHQGTRKSNHKQQFRNLQRKKSDLEILARRNSFNNADNVSQKSSKANKSPRNSITSSPRKAAKSQKSSPRSPYLSPRSTFPTANSDVSSPRFEHKSGLEIVPSPKRSPKNTISRSNSFNSENSLKRSSSKEEDDESKRKLSKPVNALIVSQKLKETQDKTEIISNLKKNIKQYHKIPDSFNKFEFCIELDHLLTDDSWELRNEATLLTKDLVPYLKDDLDTCMNIVLPSIIINMGHRDNSLRKSTVELVRIYARVTTQKQILIDKIIENGIKRSRGSALYSILESLRKIINRSFAQMDFSNFIEILSNNLTSREFEDPSIEALKRIRHVIGTNNFEHFASKLNANTKKILFTILEIEDDPNIPDSHSQPEDEDEDNNDDRRRMKEEGYPPALELEPVRRSSRGWIEYGVVDQDIMDKIRHEVSTRTTVYHKYLSGSSVRCCMIH